MATTHTDTNVNQLVINKMTKQEYDNLSQVSENELWLVEEQVDSAVTQGSTNPVQSGAVYDALQEIQFDGLKQVDCTTYQGEAGEIVQHIGTTSGDLVNGYVYKETNVHSLTYNSVTYNYVGETDDNVTWKLYKITQDNIDYVVPQGVTIGDNFWVVRDFTDLEVVHIFEIDNISDNVESTQMNIEGHFLGTNITLHFVAPYSEIINTSKALIYKNGNNYLYCDSTFKFFASSVNNNNANVIPFDGTINNDYIWQRINVQPQQLSLENSKVKYTLSDNTTKLTLAQESDLKTVAFSGSYNDLTDKLQNATTSAAGLMSADDKVLVSGLERVVQLSYNYGSIFKVNNIVILDSIIDPNAQLQLPVGAYPIEDIIIHPLPSETITISGSFIYGTQITQRRSFVAVYLSAN